MTEQEMLRRISACLNACRGIETTVLEGHSLGVIAATHSQLLHDAEKQQEAEPVGVVNHADLQPPSALFDPDTPLRMAVEETAPRSIQGLPKGTKLYAFPPISAAQPTVLEVGIRGKVYDPPKTCRAYTFKEQPDNVGAWRLGEAVHGCNSVSSGNLIDVGLGLLKHLEKHGFGVYELSAAKEEGK